MSERSKNLALFLVVYVILDVTAVRVYDVLAGPSRDLTPVRTASPFYHHDLRKNVDGWTRWGTSRYRFFTNSLGFRDERVRTVPPCSENARILLLGDSFTEGVGVTYPETFAGILAHELHPRGIEVLNAGVVSYSPTIYRQKSGYLLERTGLKVDLILVLIDETDVMDEAWLDEHGHTRFLDDHARPPSKKIKAWLAKRSLILRTAAEVKTFIERHRGERGHRTRLALDVPAVAWDHDQDAYARYGARGLRRAAENMDGLLTLARRHGIPVAVAVYPWPDEIHRGLRASRQVRFWRAWAGRRRVPFLDLFPAFIDGADPEPTIRRFFIPYDYHWNAAGHRRVAEALLEAGLPDLLDARTGLAVEEPPQRCSTTIHPPSADPRPFPPPGWGRGSVPPSLASNLHPEG